MRIVIWLKTKVLQNMERQELRKALPKGFRGVIAKRAGFSTQYVDMWFRGVRNNLHIENIALEYLAEVLEENKRLKKRIKAAL